MRTERITSFNPGTIKVVVESFGYLHGPPPPADITIDIRDVARDPHTSLEMRELTGLEPQVRRSVLGNPGGLSVLAGLQHITLAFLPAKDRAGQLVRVAVGCAGGRHRSVVLANELVTRLVWSGVAADVSHRDILKPVVNR
jgi:UPF0042 nucleotide-binding protein